MFLPDMDCKETPSCILYSKIPARVCQRTPFQANIFLPWVHLRHLWHLIITTPRWMGSKRPTLPISLTMEESLAGSLAESLTIKLVSHSVCFHPDSRGFLIKGRVWRNVGKIQERTPQGFRIFLNFLSRFC